MENFGFHPKIKAEYIFVRASLDFNKLLFLYKINAFKNTNNWNKLLILIDLSLNGRRLSTLKRYLDLVNYKEFKTGDISKKNNCSFGSSYDWLNNATKAGYIIKKIKRIKNTNVALWATIDKSKELVKTLEQWKQDLDNLKKEKRIQDSLILLESIKLKKKDLTKECAYSEGF